MGKRRRAGAFPGPLNQPKRERHANKPQLFSLAHPVSATPFSRRQWLQTVSGGFGYLALAGLCAEESPATSPLAPKTPHFAPRAKRIIFL